MGTLEIIAMCINSPSDRSGRAVEENGRNDTTTMVQKQTHDGRIPMSDSLPVHVTVVIPTRNEEAAIVDTIRACRQVGAIL